MPRVYLPKAKTIANISDESLGSLVMFRLVTSVSDGDLWEATPDLELMLMQQQHGDPAFRDGVNKILDSVLES